MPCSCIAPGREERQESAPSPFSSMSWGVPKRVGGRQTPPNGQALGHTSRPTCSSANHRRDASESHHVPDAYKNSTAPLKRLAAPAVRLGWKSAVSILSEIAEQTREPM